MGGAADVLSDPVAVMDLSVAVPQIAEIRSEFAAFGPFLMSRSAVARMTAIGFSRTLDYRGTCRRRGCSRSPFANNVRKQSRGVLMPKGVEHLSALMCRKRPVKCRRR